MSRNGLPGLDTPKVFEAQRLPEPVVLEHLALQELSDVTVSIGTCLTILRPATYTIFGAERFEAAHEQLRKELCSRRLDGLVHMLKHWLADRIDELGLLDRYREQ